MSHDQRLPRGVMLNTNRFLPKVRVIDDVSCGGNSAETTCLRVGNEKTCSPPLWGDNLDNMWSDHFDRMLPIEIVSVCHSSASSAYGWSCRPRRWGKCLSGVVMTTHSPSGGGRSGRG